MTNNNDDQFKKTNANPDSGLGAELEARVVAWVLGEASAFEAAELERLCAEQPALAEFKRRMETVSGWTGEAAKPLREPLRLSAERRAKLLAVIGGGAGAKPAAVVSAVKSKSVRKKRVRSQAWRQWALPLAACLTLMTGLAVVIVPTLEDALVLSKKPKRPNPDSTVIGPDNGDMELSSSLERDERPLEERLQVARKAGGSSPSPVVQSAPMVSFPQSYGVATGMGFSSESERRNVVVASSGEAGVSLGVDAPASPPPPATSAPAPSAAPMTRTGTGTLNLSGANTYTGGTTVNGGGLTVGGRAQTNESLTVYYDNAQSLGTGAKQLAAAEQKMDALKSLEDRGTFAEASKLAATSGDLAMASADALTTDGDAVKLNFDQARGGLGARQEQRQFKASANKSEPQAGDGFAVAANAPVLGDVPVLGRAFRGNESNVAFALAGIPVEESLKGSTASASPDKKASERRRESFPAAAADPFAAPTPEMEKAAAAQKEYESTRELFAKGRSQYLAGDIDGATENFRTLEAIAPENKAGKDFLNRLQKESVEVGEYKRSKVRDRQVEEVAHAWGKTEKSKMASTTTPEEINARLDRIVVPSVNFSDVPMDKVIASLTSVSTEYDAASSADRGADIILLNKDDQNPSVSATFRNLSLRKILDQITAANGYRYEVRGSFVVVLPKESAVKMQTMFFPVTKAEVLKFIGSEEFAGGESTALRSFFEKAGVDFISNERSALAYDGASIIVTQTARSLERIREILESYAAEERRKYQVDDALRDEIPTATEAISTFSLHVSDASFRLAQATLLAGQMPEAGSIRPEEFYNAFDYGDPAPGAGEAVACRVEQAAHPFLQQRNLVRVAMRVPAVGRGAGQPLRLTVLLDTSGSMEREDRAATVRAAFASLASLLGPNDRVTLIGFARTPRLLAESVPGDQAAKLIELAVRTPAEGGTNLEEALVLAGRLAERQKTAGAQNRIVVLTDGAANLGDADPVALTQRVEALRQGGIAFDACGIVADGLDDTVLEALTRKGDGRYAVVNSPEDADASFARQLAGAFRPAAKDVKVQVRFNPARVTRYRLIGFEKHRLKTEDFRNDAVDAAELASEEAAVALYQVEVKADGEGELGEVSVRFLDTGSNERVERMWTLAYAAQVPAFARATPSLQLAGSAAFLAEKLRGGSLAGQVRLDEFAPVVEGLAAAYPQQQRVRELITMFRQARTVTGE